MKGIQIPVFAGGDFELWVRKFECVALAKDWKEEEKVKHLPLFLEGEVFLFHDSLDSTVKKSYQASVEELKKVFGPRRESVLVEFQQMKLESGKSPRLFLLALKNLCNKCYPQMDDSVKEIIIMDQLKKGTPKQFVNYIVSNPALDSADKIVEVLDKLMSTGGVVECNAIESQTQKQDGNRVSSEIKELQEQVALLVTKAKQGNRIEGRVRSIQCYRCGEFGHISRFCKSQLAGKDSETSGRSHRRL